MRSNKANSSNVETQGARPMMTSSKAINPSVCVWLIEVIQLIMNEWITNEWSDTPNLTATMLKPILTEEKISHWFSKIHLFAQKWEFSKQEFLTLNICLLQRKKKKVYSMHQKFRDKQNSNNTWSFQTKARYPLIGTSESWEAWSKITCKVRGRTDKESRFLKRVLSETIGSTSSWVSVSSLVKRGN